MFKQQTGSILMAPCHEEHPGATGRWTHSIQAALLPVVKKKKIETCLSRFVGIVASPFHPPITEGLVAKS